VNYIINDEVYFKMSENMVVKKTKKTIKTIVNTSDINYYCIPLSDYKKRGLTNKSTILKEVKINPDGNE
jgi:hypothetical protein